MKAEEKKDVEIGVKHDLMPEIKALIPVIAKWLLAKIFPRIEVAINQFIERKLNQILEGRK